jgi:glycosyltransferase involved in cell wall biosynthesis
MKIAFATLYDTRDIKRGSGTFYYMSREIESQGHTVHYIGPIDFKYPLVSRVLRAVHRRMGKRYLTFLDPFVGRLTGQEAARRLANLDYDILITNDFAIAAFTDIDRPIVIYTDAMITKDYSERNYPHSRLANVSFVGLFFSRATIKRGLRRAALCVFPARWSLKEAQNYCRCPEKIVAIAFGANIDDPGESIAAKRSFFDVIRKNRIDLLFVGKEWPRKGGDIAVKTVKELRSRGISAFLHVVGSVPPYAVDRNYIIVYDYLDKAKQEGKTKIDELYRKCDVFIFPSSHEGFGIVALEAAAYGLPVVAYNTIGVSDAVKENETGILMKLGQSQVAFANAIEAWFVNPEKYNLLVKNARKYYEDTGNWSRSVSQLMKMADKKVL